MRGVGERALEKKGERGIDLVRNFAIAAHVDHGKSTLADRLIERCGGLPDREMREQVLDSMDLERERGITIKAQTVRLKYKARDGREYCLNVMDTPGHADFSYEVSRSMAACEGSLLLVDATQGVEAQTLANAWLSVEAGHEVVVALNKKDLASADLEGTRLQIEEALGLDAGDATATSGKTGEGLDDLLEQLVLKIPAPRGDEGGLLRAMVVDSWYDAYVGVVVLVRLYDGELRKGDKVRFLSTGKEHVVSALGWFTPRREEAEVLSAGEVGWFTAGIKEASHARVGDTFCRLGEDVEALEGMREVRPVVYCGVYPEEGEKFEELRGAAEKIRLNDGSFVYEAEKNVALGMGLRCGFLGLLHVEVVCERMRREFGVGVYTTAPGVLCRVKMRDGSVREVGNPADFPDMGAIMSVEEPWVKATAMCRVEDVGGVMGLCEERRGRRADMTVAAGRAVLTYELPLAEVVYDFGDRLKSLTRGHGSVDWRVERYEEGDVVKVRVLVNNEEVDALSFLSHRSRAEGRGREICEALKELIPRHMFAVPLQAAIGGKVLARETIGALRKDVTSKCYGGDVTRKRKLLEKQKAGKKKMRRFGRVDVPAEAFTAALRTRRGGV